MKYKEFGCDHAKTIVFLHGGGLSWWNYREEAELLEHEYHVIIPFLDGHAESDAHFSTIEANAKEIIAFINEHLNGSVFLICGLSLGGQILLEMLSQKGDICQYAFIESAMAVPSRIIHALIPPAFGCSYPLIRQKWFAKMQFRQLRIKAALFDEYYRDTCAISKENYIAFLKANTSYTLKESLKDCTARVRIYYGEKENRGIKTSAQMISRMIPSGSRIELPAMYHGEFSLNHSQDYINAIRSMTDPC